MKKLALVLLFSLPAFSQDVTAKFKEAEAHAPKGYPTLFVVASASTQPGEFLGRQQSCAMDIETLGQVYQVAAAQGFTSACKVFTPGTVLYGKVHSLMGQVVDLLDTTEVKPKSRRYLVQNIVMVDPAKQ